MNNKVKILLIIIILLSFVSISNVSAEENVDSIAEVEEVAFDNEPKFEELEAEKIEPIQDSEKETARTNEDDLKSTISTEEDTEIILEEEKPIVFPKIQLNEVDSKNFADVVVLQGLDKITAKSSYLESQVGQTINFKRLEIEPIKCWKAPPKETPENKVLLKIYENKLNGKKEQIFYGWMFSSSPALSTLEHPVYDITVIDCKFNKIEEGEVKNDKQ